MNRKAINYIFTLLSLTFIYFLINNNKIVLESVSFSISIWKDNLFPTLFPFLVILSILIDIGSINIRFLPSLELANPFEINENSINIIEMSNNSRYCCGWSDEEEELYIIFDPYFID